MCPLAKLNQAVGDCAKLAEIELPQSALRRAYLAISLFLVNKNIEFIS